MAELIACPVCKKEISDEAPQCIHCGHPMQPMRTMDEPRRWETCRIEWETWRIEGWIARGQPIGVHKFWVEASSPVVGGYYAAESP